MSERTRKVASLVRQIVATEIVENITAPEITVTDVDVSPDLRTAIVWIGLLNQSRQDELLARIEDHRPDVQARIAKSLTTKFVPKISFRLDDGLDHALRINEIIRTVNSDQKKASDKPTV
jgi:ribosome-binding factor A